MALLAGCTADGSEIQVQNQPSLPISAVLPTADPVVKSNLNTYKSSTAGFEISYPNDFLINSIPDSESNVILTLLYPDYYKKGTNLNYAKIIVSESQEKGDVAKCTIGEATGKPLTITKTVHSQVLYQETWSEGAAGHTGDSVQYSTVFYGSTCFKLLFQGYATNLALLNQDSQKGVAYDKTKLVDIFNTIVETFTLYRDA